MPPKATICKRRVGRGNDSYLLLDGLLGERQLEAVRKFVSSSPVRTAVKAGVLFDENTDPTEARKAKAERQRRSDIAWLYKNAEAAAKEAAAGKATTELDEDDVIAALRTEVPKCRVAPLDDG